MPNSLKWIFTILTSVGLQLVIAEEKHAYCAYYRDDQVSDEENHSYGQIMPDNVTIRCNGSKDFCFSFWTPGIDENNTEITLIRQDCWGYSEVNDCSGECTPKPRFSGHASQKYTNALYCCCHGNKCNANISSFDMITLLTSEVTSTPVSSVHIEAYDNTTILIISLCILIFACVTIIISFLLYRIYWKPRMPSLEPLNPEPSTTPGFDMSNVKMLDVIAKGKYGEVWSGKLNGDPVAIKIFSANHRQFYNNEKYIYSLPHMDYDNLLRFYGADELINSDGVHQYCLVLSYIPKGTLMAYLRDHTVDWTQMCKIALTLTHGLAHLHCDINKGDQFKPAIAHRDFNSRNVLIRPDLSCVVADLGFCMTTMGSKVIRNGHTESAEQSSLTDVGTIRYMAPELLDGAVNLRDCEASLKQIDVYALGLVVWEIASRCSDLYQGVAVPEYMLPYQAEVGVHPSFEEMQILVCGNKKRPLFPDVWKDSNMAIHTLKETIEDCWDHDAEARLTSFCVIERIMDLTTLWAQDSRQKGVTPTLNSSAHITVSEDATGIPMVHRSRFPGLSNVAGESATSLPMDNSMAPLISHGSSGDGMPNGQPRNSWTPQDKSVSALTTETLLTISPSESDPPPDYHSIAPNGPPPDYDPEKQTGYNLPKSRNVALPNGQPRNSWMSPEQNSVTRASSSLLTASESDPPPKYQNITRAKTNCVIQPHQGRNPTVERNTHKRSDEELAVSGNTLITAGTKKEMEQKDQSMSASSQFHEDSFDIGPDNLETSLVQNDTLNYHRNAPIQYLQNQVHSDSPLVRPKIANVPGNGVPYSKLAINEKPQKSRFKLKKTSKDFTSKLNHLTQIGKNFLTRSSPNIEGKGSEKNERNMSDRTGYINLVSSPQQPVQTQVCLQNGNTVVQPLSNVGLTASPGPTTNNQDRLRLSEMGIAGIESVHQNGHVPMMAANVPVKSSSLEASPDDLHSNLRYNDFLLKQASPAGSYNELNDARNRRPTSLSLKLQNLQAPNGQKSSDKSLSQLPEEQSQQAMSDPSEKIRNRVKTPLKINRNRLSLYDDRVMSLSYDDLFTGVDKSRHTKSSYSLQQFDSSSSVTIDLPDLHTAKC